MTGISKDISRKIVIPDLENFKHLRNSSDILIGEKINDETLKSYPGIEYDSKIKTSLYRYYGIDHQKINDVFRIPELKAKEEDKETIYNIDRALKLIKPYRLIDDFVVWRGVKLSEKNKLPHKKRYYEELINLPKSGVINNLSYSSTSYNVHNAMKFAHCCLLEIIVRRSENLEYILIETEDEAEILFEHSTHFKYIRDYEETYEDKKVRVFVVELKKGLLNINLI